MKARADSNIAFLTLMLVLVLLFCINHNMFSHQHKLAKYQPTIHIRSSGMHIVIYILSFELLLVTVEIVEM